MKNLILLLTLFISIYSSGQNFAIKSKHLKTFNIKLDSIEVQISVFEDRIETESYFERSKSKLSVVYSKSGKSYNYIKTRENHLIYADCCRINEFDFENGKVFNGNEMYYLTQNLRDITGKFEEVRDSYSKTLNSKFIEKYVTDLFEKIKNYQ